MKYYIQCTAVMLMLIFLMERSNSDKNKVIKNLRVSPAIHTSSSWIAPCWNELVKRQFHAPARFSIKNTFTRWIANSDTEKRKKKVVFSAITRFSNTKSLESVSESVFKSDLCRLCKI